MEFKAFRNYELDPGTRQMVSSLSGGRAVGAFVMHEQAPPPDNRTACFITPVGADEILFDSDYEPIRESVRKDAAEQFTKMFNKEDA